MEWLNVFGLIFTGLLLVPNIIYAIKQQDGFKNKWNNKTVEFLEQIGRFGCIAFMCFHIPGTWFGWWSDEGFALYFIINSLLILAYLIIWIICFRKDNLFRALALSILPSVLFLFSGIMSRSLLLILSALLFAPCHILISCKNAGFERTETLE